RAIDRSERGGKRLNRERQTVEDGRDQESAEGKHDRAAGQRLEGAADRTSRPQHHEDVVPEDGRRQDQRQRNQRIDRPASPAARQRKPARERQSDRQQYDRRRRREPKAEEDGGPVHEPNEPYPLNPLQAGSPRSHENTKKIQDFLASRLRRTPSVGRSSPGTCTSQNSSFSASWPTRGSSAEVIVPKAA